jgi:membrane fusion protein, multidrug efflux system
VLGAVATGLAVLRQFSIHPQTDDAEVFANLSGIAPEVDGRIKRIDVRDNWLVFDIDSGMIGRPTPSRTWPEPASRRSARP